MPRTELNATVVACCALTTVLGTIHAFSVFVPEWEQQFNASRAAVSFIYSVALITLTAAVLVGYRIYSVVPAFVIVCMVGIFAAIGLFLSAFSTSLLFVYLFYGVLFGGANGVGYGFALQLAGQAVRVRRGLAMSLVTAFYAVGATSAPPLFGLLIERGGNELALMAIGTIVVVVALLAALLIRKSGVAFNSESRASRVALSTTLKHTRRLLWFGYGCAVTAGLMVIGHAYSIAIWLGFTSDVSRLATTIVAFGNMIGGFAAGYFADRASGFAMLYWLPLVTAAGLLLLIMPVGTNWVYAFVSLCAIGYCYGSVIAIYPVAIVDIFGSSSAPRIYGQIFTAWGLAGLVGPWISGWLYDQHGSYKLALLFAMVLSAISAIVIWHRQHPAAR